jgi:hypothetical protein
MTLDDRALGERKECRRLLTKNFWCCHPNDLVGARTMWRDYARELELLNMAERREGLCFGWARRDLGGKTLPYWILWM